LATQIRSQYALARSPAARLDRWGTCPRGCPARRRAPARHALGLRLPLRASVPAGRAPAHWARAPRGWRDRRLFAWPELDLELLLLELFFPSLSIGALTSVPQADILRVTVGAEV